MQNLTHAALPPKVPALLPPRPGTGGDGGQAADAKRDLFEAMKEVALTGKGPAVQIPSMGCSIKWKEE